MEINGKHYCDSCFNEYEAYPCPVCGYKGYNDGTAGYALSPGSVLLGKYSVGKILGKGGFGITYLGFSMTEKKVVAIKEYYPDGVVYRANDNGAVAIYTSENEENYRNGAEKFYEEASILARFNGHPNIVSVNEFFYENNTAYFIMEYVTGSDLKTVMKRRGKPFDEGELISFTAPLLNALEVIHNEGVLHRDISPDNIFITESGGIKLLDFGAARQLFTEKSKSLSVVLKPGYAPLEQYQKRGAQGPWTDIYALGATLYYCLFCVSPDDAMSRFDHDGVYEAIDGNTTLSNQFKAVLKKMLTVKVDDRYPDVFSLENDFGVILKLYKSVITPPADEPIPNSANDKPAKPGSKKIIPVIAAAAVVLIAVITIISIGVAKGKQDDETTTRKEGTPGYSAEQNATGSDDDLTNDNNSEPTAQVQQTGDNTQQSGAEASTTADVSDTTAENPGEMLTNTTQAGSPQTTAAEQTQARTTAAPNRPTTAPNTRAATTAAPRTTAAPATRQSTTQNNEPTIPTGKSEVLNFVISSGSKAAGSAPSFVKRESFDIVGRETDPQLAASIPVYFDTSSQSNDYSYSKGSSAAASGVPRLNQSDIAKASQANLSQNSSGNYYVTMTLGNVDSNLVSRLGMNINYDNMYLGGQVSSTSVKYDSVSLNATFTPSGEIISLDATLYMQITFNAKIGSADDAQVTFEIENAISCSGFSY